MRAGTRVRIRATDQGGTILRDGFGYRRFEQRLLCGGLALLVAVTTGCHSGRSPSDIASELTSSYQLTNVACTEAAKNKEGGQSFHCTFDPDPKFDTTQADVDLSTDGAISAVNYLDESGQRVGADFFIPAG